MAETCRELLGISGPAKLSARKALEQKNGVAALRIENRTSQVK